MLGKLLAIMLKMTPTPTELRLQVQTLKPHLPFQKIQLTKEGVQQAAERYTASGGIPPAIPANARSKGGGQQEMTRSASPRSTRHSSCQPPARGTHLGRITAPAEGLLLGTDGSRARGWTAAVVGLVGFFIFKLLN